MHHNSPDGRVHSTASLPPAPIQRPHSAETFLKRNVFVLMLALSATVSWAWPQQDPGGGSVTETKTVDIVASRFKFEPATITVAQGDRVRLRLRSTDRAHGISIRPFRVRALIPTSETVTVEFVADKAGTFAFSCSESCGTGHSTMKGQLVVLAKAN